MDALDRRILDELALQCRVSFSKLAEKFGVSLNTIKNRVEALAEQGVIVDFVVQLHLDILRASFAVVMLDIKSNTGRKNLISLGDHPFIMALGLGYEMLSLHRPLTTCSHPNMLRVLRHYQSLDLHHVLTPLHPRDSIL